jgi:hypothetical protein
MRRRGLIVLAATATLLTSASVFAVTRGAHGSSGTELFDFSTRGKPVALAWSSARAFHVSSATVVALREGRAFYRLVTADGVCYATGPAAEVGMIGGEECPPAGTFPSAARPLLDLSVYEADQHTGHTVHAFRIEGFAADGVATVALRSPSGRESVRVPVSQNVFALHAGSATTVGSVVARDSGGQEVASLSR